MNHAISKEITLLIKNYRLKGKIGKCSNKLRRSKEMDTKCLYLFMWLTFLETVAVEAFLERLR